MEKQATTEQLAAELADAKAEVERLRGRAESAISIVLGVAAKLVTTAPADGDMPLRNDDLHSRLAGHALTLKGACQVLRGKTDADLAAKEREP